MNRDSRKPPVIICTGISLLFVTFIIVCLVIFALLSFNTAKADNKLRAKRVEGITEYYTASAKANQTVARIDRILENLAISEMDRGDGILSLEELQAVFDNQTDIVFTAAKQGGFPQLSFSESINQNRSIEVTLLLTDASFGKLKEHSANNYYLIKSWKTVVADSQNASQ